MPAFQYHELLGRWTILALFLFRSFVLFDNILSELKEVNAGVWVWVCGCLHICVYACAYVRVARTCSRVRVCVCASASDFIHEGGRVWFVCMFIGIYGYVYVCMCTWLCVWCVFIRAWLHTCVHVRACLCLYGFCVLMCVCAFSCW